MSLRWSMVKNIKCSLNAPFLTLFYLQCSICASVQSRGYKTVLTFCDRGTKTKTLQPIRQAVLRDSKQWDQSSTQTSSTTRRSNTWDLGSSMTSRSTSLEMSPCSIQASNSDFKEVSPNLISFSFLTPQDLLKKFNKFFYKKNSDDYRKKWTHLDPNRHLPMVPATMTT